MYGHGNIQPNNSLGDTSKTASSYANSQQTEVLSNLLNLSSASRGLGQSTTVVQDENMPSTGSGGSVNSSSGGSMSYNELLKELNETKDKLKVITQKFVTVRKERD